MNTLMNNDLLKIEKEIVSMKNRVAQDLIQIGQKLIDAKRLVPHGEWSVWLSEKVGFSQRTANNLMRVAKELGENSQSLSNLEATKLYMLLELPSEERDVFIQENDLKTISTREMQRKIQSYKRNKNHFWNIVDKDYDPNIYDILVDDLKPFPNHAEFFWDITGKEWLNFIQSVDKDGIIVPIIITRDNMIVSGHQRVRACKDLGIESIPARYLYTNKSDEKLEDILLKTFITSNMFTGSCVFWLACAWQELYFGQIEKYEEYIKKFIEYDDSKYKEWLDNTREKRAEIKARKHALQ